MGYALARVIGDPNCHIEKRPATNLKEVSKNLEDSESTFKRRYRWVLHYSIALIFYGNKLSLRTCQLARCCTHLASCRTRNLQVEDSRLGQQATTLYLESKGRPSDEDSSEV
uniref:Uncharacterized protein n=1 Tax=Opuntia streptacantha TaxID=393608 RepID=A0A7C9EAK3_OPUST